MLYNYIFVFKLISFKNFNIVSPATFVNKSNRIDVVESLTNIRNIHAEYIPVVPHYLTNNYKDNNKITELRTILQRESQNS
jgi:lipopolysaccharide biosynthesis regulator YciM